MTQPQHHYNTLYILVISMISAMGGLLFGYDWVVVAGAKIFYEAYFRITGGAMIGWMAASCLVGCMIGAACAGYLTDRYGRKRMLIISAALYTISAVGCGIAGSLTTLVIYRILGGIGLGVASTVSPMYIAEVAPAAIRGRLVTLNQLSIVIGILMAQIVNWYIGNRISEPVTLTLAPGDSSPAALLQYYDQLRQGWEWLVDNGWRWMFGIEAIPAAVFLLAAWFIPESPRWLVKNNDAPRARGILERIGNAGYAAAALHDIQATLSDDKRHAGFGELLKPRMRAILVLGIVLAVLQQWCGINVVFTYASEVFQSAGFAAGDTLNFAVLIGVINAIFTLAGMALVDRWGRKPLLLTGFLGLAVCYIFIGICYYGHFSGWYLVALVVIALACYAATLAPVVWVVLSEIFPNRVRGEAMSMAVLALWIACFVLTYTFPIIRSPDALDMHGSFWLYSAICFAGFVFILKKVPETKNKTLEQIERELVGVE